MDLPLPNQGLSLEVAMMAHVGCHMYRYVYQILAEVHITVVKAAYQYTLPGREALLSIVLGGLHH